MIHLCYNRDLVDNWVTKSPNPEKLNKCLIQSVNSNRDGVMLNEKIFEILVCPKCKQKVEYQEKKGIVCHNCKLVYPIRNEIPVMLISEADELKN